MDLKLIEEDLEQILFEVFFCSNRLYFETVLTFLPLEDNLSEVNRKLFAFF